jgi:hypothetical protein
VPHAQTALVIVRAFEICKIMDHWGWRTCFVIMTEEVMHNSFHDQNL